MFISEALAQTEAAAEALPEGSGMRLLVQFALIFGIFYLVLIRPQTKRAKEHKKRINAVVIGDKVICGGIFGKITKIINEFEIELEVSEGVKIKMLKDLISEVNPDVIPMAPANTDKKEKVNPNSKAEKLKAAFTKK